MLVWLFTVTLWLLDGWKSKRLELITEIDEESIRLREEVSLQYQALQKLLNWVTFYGVGVRRLRYKAINGQHRRKWLICRVVNGAATSLGRVPIVLDIYAERGSWYLHWIREIQKLLVTISLWSRTVKFARTKAYDQCVLQVTQPSSASMAGMGNDGRHRVY